MADINKALVHKLKNNPGVSALVSDRVYHARLPQTVTLPAVTYQQISQTTTPQHGAPSTLPRPRIQITAWANSFETAYGVGQAIKAAIDGKRETWGTGAYLTEVQACQIDTGRTFFDEPTSLWQHQQDFFIMFKE